MNTKNLIRRMSVPHPGLLLKNEIIDAYCLSITDAAGLLGITRVALSNVVNTKSGISSELALRISYVFGGSPDIWVRMQADYELCRAQNRFRKKRHKLQKFIAAATL
jgi:addiction module HigA family antidote